MSATITQTLSPASGILALIISSFFFRFYRDTRDRFFVLFALGFFTLAADWLVVSAFAPGDEVRHLFYIPRLIAFAFIAAAIIDKNRRAQ